MATFFVGQRVRIVSAHESQSYLVGTETKILAIAGAGRFKGDWVLDLRSPAGRPLCAKSHNIEPIIPDGMQPVEWSECLWQPEGVGA